MGVFVQPLDDIHALHHDLVTVLFSLRQHREKKEREDSIRNATATEEGTTM